MKKILFVDHVFHKKTKSSDFFIDILQQRFEVDRVFIDPENETLQDWADSLATCDAALLWQMDYLAPAFLSAGKPTIVIPMYDGSANMPDIHWSIASRALFINFSLTLHTKQIALGNNSVLVKYFPLPDTSDNQARFDEGLNVFFWQRRPREGLTADLVARMIQGNIKKFHVHDAPDLPAKTVSAPIVKGAKTTVSKWYENGAAYKEHLSNFNVYVAPRHAEGIGMGFLEAMARGMVVIAYDMPTHNEYISNWSNGILFNTSPDPVINLDSDTARRIGALAATTVKLGHEQWQACIPEVLAQIELYLGSFSPPEDTVDLSRPLTTAYYQGVDVYESFLVRLARSVPSLMSITNERSRPDAVAIREERLDSLWLTEGELRIYEYPKGHVTSGITLNSNDAARLVSSSYEIRFKLDLSAGMPSIITFDFMKDQPVTVAASINDVAVSFDLNIKSIYSLSTVDFPLRRENLISIILIRQTAIKDQADVFLRRISIL
ncbi:hypothetical protein OB03_06820 [Brevundimonas sp. GN22]